MTHWDSLYVDRDGKATLGIIPMWTAMLLFAQLYKLDSLLSDDDQSLIESIQVLQ